VQIVGKPDLEPSRRAFSFSFLFVRDSGAILREHMYDMATTRQVELRDRQFVQPASCCGTPQPTFLRVARIPPRAELDHGSVRDPYCHKRSGYA